MDIGWKKQKSCCYASQRLAFSTTKSGDFAERRVVTSDIIMYGNYK